MEKYLSPPIGTRLGNWRSKRWTKKPDAKFGGRRLYPKPLSKPTQSGIRRRLRLRVMDNGYLCFSAARGCFATILKAKSCGSRRWDRSVMNTAPAAHRSWSTTKSFLTRTTTWTVSLPPLSSRRDAHYGECRGRMPCEVIQLL